MVFSTFIPLAFIETFHSRVLASFAGDHSYYTSSISQWRSYMYIVATVALASVEIHQQLAWSTLDFGAVALSSTLLSSSLASHTLLQAA
jgi:hypothetical protein